MRGNKFKNKQVFHMFPVKDEHPNLFENKFYCKSKKPIPTRKYGIISTIGIKQHLKYADQAATKPAFEKLAENFHNTVNEQNYVA
jgi:hypothetical protein